MDNAHFLATTTGSRVAAPLSTIAAYEPPFQEAQPVPTDTTPAPQRRDLPIMLFVLLFSILLVCLVPNFKQVLQRRPVAKHRAESMAQLEKQFRNTQLHVANNIVVVVEKFVSQGEIEHARRHFVSNIENTTKNWNKNREKVVRSFHTKFPGETIPDFPRHRIHCARLSQDTQRLPIAGQQPTCIILDQGGYSTEPSSNPKDEFKCFASFPTSAQYPLAHPASKNYLPRCISPPGCPVPGFDISQ